ncbi:tubulin polyglutamylase ttll6-like isoform X2 [Mizuhopecten yessoensis]|uniref:tubulin polyglutamylase ttll6-like isoform X2 n=1 Tax=Mizuhopecten yessoensis TaxID=6573 RepID=UPI000B45862D|nr:tubulin polyglutamylase ttll6-like isoform X2 [Mizuhopecten yessoensis]
MDSPPYDKDEQSDDQSEVEESTYRDEPEEVVSGMSDSDSESDQEVDPDGTDSGYDNNDGGGGGPELSLMDGVSILVQQPLELEGEGDDYGDEDTGISTQADDASEYEGEGSSRTEQLQQTDLEKKELEKKAKKKKKKKKIYYICLANCKYDVVRKVSRKFGFKEVGEDEDWTLYWTDYSVALERVMDMKKYQKINHFPGMSEICRKDMLARNLNRMLKLFPKEYNVFPKTWCLPADHGDFLAYTRQKKNKTYILKPETGCQGKGIWVTKNPKEIKPHEHMICQQYMCKPLLLDGFKFDLRIYVLVTSCDPLRIFLFKDGLARFATNKYNEPTNSNIDNVFMHLTNYAINKHSTDFIRDDEAGSKRKISTVDRYMREKGFDIDKMWNDIDDVIIKTLISAHSVLKHNYRTCFPNHVKGSACFEILGFDVLLDRKLRPSILEVNHSPSFNTDSELDREIKGALVWDTLNLVNFGACDRRRCIEEEKRRIKERLLGRGAKKETKEELELAQAQYLEILERYENGHLGNFRRIYPAPGWEKYDKFFHSSGTLFQETAAFKARSELARQQRDDIARKKEKLESMLKGKKVNTTGLRPESPNSRRRRTLRRTTMPSRRLLSSRNSLEVMGSESSRQVYDEPVDTSKPMDILEEEELERISGLLQRDNLVRGLGIVEHVYRLLHCTPGTMGVLKTDSRALPPPLIYIHNPLATRPDSQSDRDQVTSGSHGHHHHLHSINTVDSSNTSCYASMLGSVALHPYNMPSNQITPVPQPYLPHPYNLSSTHLTPIPRGYRRRGDASASNNVSYTRLVPFSQSSAPLSSTMQPTYGSSSRSTAWQGKSGSLGSLNEKTVPSYQPSGFYTLDVRSKFGRKPLGGANRSAGGTSIIPETEYRNNMSHLMDTEAERARLLAKNGYTATGEWRSDNTTPSASHKRTLSAHGQRKEDYSGPLESVPLDTPNKGPKSAESSGINLPRVPANSGPQGLSVVSAPAPVVQRPELASRSELESPGAMSITRVGSNQSMPESQGSSAHLRSTKSQRIRGATNNLRLRQLELRENHAVVFS